MKNLYEELTNQIISRIENASGRWEKGFLTIPDPPRNLTGRLYTGINTLVLNNPNYQNQIYGTFDQINFLGGSVKKGEVSQTAVFWKKLNIEEPDPQSGETVTKMIPLLKYFNVFNIDQTTLAKEKATSPTLLDAQNVIDNMPNKPYIKVDKTVEYAFYFLKNDIVTIPSPEQFNTKDLFFSTFFHELGHSTGHHTRLNRKLKAFEHDQQSYAREELIAELAASFLCARTGYTSEIQENNNTYYLQHWLKFMKEDSKFIFNVCSQAQQAVNYILNVTN